MANRLLTVFQNLDSAISGNWDMKNKTTPHNNSYDLSNTSYGRDVVYKAKDKEDYIKTKLELQQNAYLNNRWQKANVDLSVQAFNGLNNIKLMYRDADLMDSFPEIGAALDIVSEESCITNSKGSVINIYSKSERIKNVLEDLFINRLDINITAPMIIRGMCKYGNQFMLLNIDNKNGVSGWRQLPVFNVERLENGIENPYSARSFINGDKNSEKDMNTKFLWIDENNTQTPFRNWQIGHFRLLTNSMYLPYGCSYLNSARRHWRMLSLMEDMMLIYRLERSIERRVYKIYVGAIDDADVKAYVEDIANNFKRTPIIDPLTGQIDLRKNILPVHKDTPIPLLDGRTITIKDLAKEFEEGKENYVYSIQDKTLNVVPGKVIWCGKNYTAKKLLRITLDDNTYFDLAQEHEILMRDGSKKRADECKVGESIMPYYVKKDKNSKKLFDKYEKIYNPKSGKYEFTHRLIAECVDKINDRFNTVHHIDYNKYNNNPNNLLWCDYNENHKKLSELYKKRFQENSISEEYNMKVHFDDFIWNSIRDNILSNNITNKKTMLEYINSNLIEHLIHINNNNKRLNNNKFISKVILENRIKEFGFKTITEYIISQKKNHKISKIEWINGDDVYCMTVVGLNNEDDRHNFALRTFNKDGSWNNNGCFVSNCADQDIFIPVRDPNAPTPIDTLQAAQNLTAMDDIKFVQNKVLTALRMPKSFLNFEDSVGDGKNLALMDIRFTRTINRIQQAFLMELTKIASIHLYILGFDDELTNFSLSMNNPSTQAEQLEIENIQKKIGAIRDAVADPGNGIPIMSQSRALREIMKWSDKDIQNNLEEIRLEKAIAAELEKTTQIIKKTGVFDIVDKMYGEPGAEYKEGQGGGQEENGMDAGPIGGGGLPPDMGGDINGGDELDELGELGSEEDGDIQGEEGEIPIDTQEQTEEQPMESKFNKKPLINENKKKIDNIFLKRVSNKDETLFERAEILNKNLLINEEFDNLIKSLDLIKE